MEAEVRKILRTALAEPLVNDLYDRIRARFQPLGGADLALPRHAPTREPPRFE